MVAFPDHKQANVQGKRPQSVSVACIGAGLCMAGPGLWLVPAADPLTQLVKLCVSVILIGAGVYLLRQGRGAAHQEPAPQSSMQGVRIREYDARGRAVRRMKPVQEQG